MFLNVELKPQEQSVKARFAGPVYVTRGFQEKFGPDSFAIAMKTLVKIGERVGSEEGADYLQVAQFNGVTFWVIDDGLNVTYLMPEEY